MRILNQPLILLVLGCVPGLKAEIPGRRKITRNEFNHPGIRGPAARILIEFKVEKMMLQGTVVY